MDTLSNLENLGIKPKGNKIEQKLQCPNCAEIGKTNLKDTPLSVNIESGIYHCHKCGWKGCAKPKDEYANKYSLPVKDNFTNLTEAGLKFFQSRKISQPAIMNNKIVMSKDGMSVIFPYIRFGEFVNYKQRFLDRKDFRQGKDAEPIMFNYDRCVSQKEIIVCEGEIDAMSYDTAGFSYATSVNQGAPNEKDLNVDKKLECITNCYEMFESAEKIYLAVDMDANGRRLQQELIRRFGAERCLLVDFSPFKDANEVLMNQGVTELRKTLENAKEVPVSGIFRAEDVWDEMQDTFTHGKPKGTTTYIPVIDAAWKWRNDLNLWTGYQNEGKTTFLLQLCLIKAYWEGWKFAVFSPENIPVSEFYDDLIEAYIGKPCDPDFKAQQMSRSEYKEAFDFVNQHFFIIYPEDNFSIQTVFDKARHLIRKYGCRALIIDPYNTIEHQMESNTREDLYISKFMSHLKRFSNENQVSVHLVAHQKTPVKDSNGRYYKPDLNNIKGGGTFPDKADNVLFVWRPERALDFSNPEVIFGSQKIRKQRLTGTPQDVWGIMFNRLQNRYSFQGLSPLKLIDDDRKMKKGKMEQVEMTFKPMNGFEQSDFDKGSRVTQDGDAKY